MVTVDIDDTIQAGMHILDELAGNPEAGKVRHPNIRYNEDGIPQGASVQDFSDRLLDKLSDAYGTDLRKLSV
jgi:hypothetical protein